MADYKATAAQLASIANAIRLKGGTSAALEYPSEWITAIQNLTPSSGGSEITPADPTLEYKVTDTELISIANAIRTKSGISTQLEFPSEFVSAINSIPAPPEPETLIPFTATDVGGLALGASGLLGSMASASGIDIGFAGTNQNNAMWNTLNPNPVTFHGYKHEATGVGTDIYDYIIVDSADWLDAQSDFISEFVTEEQVDDNDSGTVNVQASWNGIPYDHSVVNYVLAEVPAPGPNETITAYGYEITFNYKVYQGRYGPEFVAKNIQTGNTLTRTAAAAESASVLPTSFRFIHTSDNSYQGSLRYSDWGLTGAIPDGSVYYNAPTSVNWTSETVNTSVFDGWGSAKVKIPNSISGLQTGWDVDDFINALNTAWANGNEDQIIIENYTGPFPNE